MRVFVVKPQGGAFNYITKGFINAFQSVGIDARYWNGDLMELENLEPDLYIGASAFRHEIPVHFRNKIKTAFHVNPYYDGKMSAHGNNINETQDAINWVLSQKPDAVFGYGYKDDVKYWTHWIDKHKIPFIEMPTAGDAVLYYPEANTLPTIDIAYLGGRWPFKAHKLDSWLVPLTKELNIKIKGWGGWTGIKGYLGHLADNDSGRTFLASAKICPCISEPHTTLYGIDIPERYFKTALCGSLPISDLVPGFERYVPAGDLVMAKDPKQYRELIKYYLSHETERKTKAKKAREHILNGHTYHHRMMNLCAKLGFNEAVERFKTKIGEFN